ncbi:hypothetical protein ACRV3R_004317 [Citrobacter freundii]
MATQPTNLPVPSEKPQDLKFNAGKIDEFVTSMAKQYIDRFGQEHYTIEGINYLAQQVMNAFGYVTLTDVSFTTGATVSNPNEVLFNESNNEYYKWTGSFSGGPKVVPANSTPESTGGIGAGKWLSVGDSTLRGELAEPDGSGMVGHGDKTVDDALTELEKTQGKDGFNTIGRFLNLAELRAFPPADVGDVVYVVSAASTSIEDIHYGGGHFQAVMKQSLADDGGVTIVPSSDSLAWVRVDRGSPCLTWFGVRPNSGIDNQAEIEKAAAYGKNNSVTLKVPAGVIQFSKGIPVYSRSGYIGLGKQKSIFEKITNTPFKISSGAEFDALALAIPDTYDPDGTSESSYCVFATISGLSFRRGGVSGRENAPAYGFWCQKMAASLVKDARFECGNFGFWGEDCWSNVFESVQFLGLSVGQYCGFSLSKYRSGVYHLSGTSNVMNLVQVANYQLGFLTASQQYTTMSCCTADGIFPMTGTGENVSSAYTFYNPHNITMNSCASEGVMGAQIRIAMADLAVYSGSMVVNSYMGVIAPKNPPVSINVFSISSDFAKRLSVVFNAGDLVVDGELTNLHVGFIDGANCYVTTVGTLLDAPQTANGAHFKAL